MRFTARWRLKYVPQRARLQRRVSPAGRDVSQETRGPAAEQQMPANSKSMPRRVRAWYGLPGEIVIQGDDWHLVKVGPLPLPHPPLINRFIRRGLPRQARLQLSYWHELGHLQALPLALAHALWLWRRGLGPRHMSLLSRLGWFTAALTAHEAAWELASESYVLARSGREYRRLYRKHPNPFLAIFWGGMAGLALLGTIVIAGTRNGKIVRNRTR